MARDWLLLSLALLLGCGDLHVSGALNSGSVTGMVSSVQITALSNSGTQVTAVTFLSSGGSNLVNFCGNVANQMPLNQTVTAQFNSGPDCNSLLNVTIVIH